MSKVIHKIQNNLNSLLHRGQKSKDPYNKRLNFNPARLLLKTLGTGGIFSPRCSRTFSNSDSKFNNYINNSKNLRIAGFSSAFILLILSALSIYPIVRNLNLAEAASPTDSTTTLNITTTNSANVQLLVKDPNGTFASSSSSESLNFNVTTNNYTGYKLTLLGKDSTYDTLYYKSGGETVGTLTSINENRTSSGFSNGYFGYTLDGTNFKPAPDNKTGDTIDDTNVANVTANNYTLGLGVKANYSTPTGTYTNTYVLTAVGNPTPYTLNFNKSTTDAVDNMPSATSDSIKDTKVALPTNVPTRTGYTFTGWCDIEPTANSNGSNICSGTTYQPSTESTTVYYDFINRTAETNIANLYAVWNINQYTCTKTYQLQNADGNYATAVSGGAEQVEYGATCTYTKTLSSSDTADYAYYNNGNSKTGTCTMTASGCTVNLQFPRNTYALTINKDSYISSVSGAGTYRWEQSVSISATASSGNEFVNWTQPSGTTGSFGSTTSTSTTFTMGKGAATIQANGKVSCISSISGTMQAFDPSKLCSDMTATSGSLTDSRDNQTYTVIKTSKGWWMTRNLAIGCNGSGASYGSIVKSRTLTSSASNVSSKYTTPTTSDFTNTFTEGKIVCDSTYGAWYNYYTASAGTISGSDSREAAKYDICPKGWHLPDYTFYESVAGYASSYSPVSGGYYSGGKKYDEARGRWWASTVLTTSYDTPYILLYISDKGTFSTSIYAVSRANGCYVRCVRSAS